MTGERLLNSDLKLLERFAGPIILVARAMLAYIFVVSGATYIGQYADVTDYMQANGVDARLLPLVIATELGGGLLVLVGLKTRWAAIALFGFCLLTALFFHSRRGSGDPLPQEPRDGGRLPDAGDFRSGPLVARLLARALLAPLQADHEIHEQPRQPE